MDTKDELTGLLPRTSFLEKLDAALAQTAIDGSPLTLAFVDIDSLLPYNDRFGHVAGDELIRQVGLAIEAAFGDQALMGRYGGDEFLVTIPNQSADTIFEMAEKLRLAVEHNRLEVVSEGQAVQAQATISIGLATFPNDASEMKDLIEKAKQALFRAKEAAGNTICFYEEKDGLTGVFNRFGIMRKLDETTSASSGKNVTTSIILLDIDQFLDLNNQFGHRTGDEVLKRLATILQTNFKDGAHVGRLGGDEFIVVLPDCRAESAFVLAEEVRKLIEDTEIGVTIATHKHNVSFRISAGIATYPSDANERVDLLRKADEALYRAKRLGRNRVCLPASSQMITKTSHYTQTQLERLASMARQLDKSEAFLLREALDDLLHKYSDSLH